MDEFSASSFTGIDQSWCNSNCSGNSSEYCGGTAVELFNIYNSQNSILDYYNLTTNELNLNYNN